MTNLSHIADNIDRIRDQIAEAAARSGRSYDDITMVAVTKTYPVDYVVAAFHSGITNAGENRVQEALPKIEVFSNDLSLSQMKWHLIGHLQSNKAKQAVQNFDLIHSIDSVKLATEINRHAASLNRIMSILLQVNVSGEGTKSGLEPGNLQASLEEILDACPHVTVEGFMTMAPFGTPEEARPSFKGLHDLRKQINSKINHPRYTGKHLSMGMSNDFQVAIEEGSTMVRIGSSIFGSRN